MSTMPGAVVIPVRYGEAMVLYTSVRVEAVVDGAPVGPNGRLFIVEAGKTTKVPYEAGRFILEHLGYTGVVRVEEFESESGITYNIQKAKEDSEALLAAGDEKRFHQYVSDCVEDYVKRSKPVPQPPKAILDIIHRRGYDLKKFGIVPIGWEDPENNSRTAELEAQVKQLSETVKQMSDTAQAERIKELEAKLELQQQIIEATTKPPGKKTGHSGG